ncbi:SitI6 family double-CXXCG motif immunity protein [Pyxidicoccus xibeiensis]|uniref:SitI6 family double-CXXCG motif immunity protein n=1 Tax=Pyxidicoccus xibeiensis TaxID=2906759 RepID=UPI0020A713BB|nr:double-CXXCG motif protein [Pyxidicoccus xibeiensis]MCP3135816.1 double-CXXCG motif protein [Pyxidicoccus xibeiensis]
MRFYSLEEVSSPRYSWSLQTEHQWLLPGVRCPTCHDTWASIGEAYPSVDLSELPERKKLKAKLEEDFAEFSRLRERVRRFAPSGAPLTPGTSFGALLGRARGPFPQLVLQNPWTVLMHREALEQLQAEGVRGLKGCRTELRFRDKHPPELLELQVEPGGLFHRDCLPPHVPCPTCGPRFSMPREPLLDAASLPTDRDLFRLANFSTVIVGSERFVDTVRRLCFEEVDFRELPTR